MGNDNEVITLVDGILKSLSADEISMIDFDRLGADLGQIRDAMSSMTSAADELACLRQDYQQRISGMIKAVAAVDRKRDRSKDALEMIESLQELEAPELIRCYRTVSARFRDSFPASLGLLRVDSGLLNSTKVTRTDQ